MFYASNSDLNYRYTNYCIKWLEKSFLWCFPRVYAIWKKNQKGDMQKDCVEPPQKWTFSFPKIMKMKNKSETVQIWHGAMI